MMRTSTKDEVDLVADKIKLKTLIFQMSNRILDNPEVVKVNNLQGDKEN